MSNFNGQKVVISGASRGIGRAISLAFLEQGATVIGPRPEKSPSLENYPACDKAVAAIASEVWGNIDGEKVKQSKYGKGTVYDGAGLEERRRFDGPAATPVRSGDRRRRLVFGHRVRSHEQRRGNGKRPAGDLERQQDVDLSTGRRRCKLLRQVTNEPVLHRTEDGSRQNAEQGARPR